MKIEVVNNKGDSIEIPIPENYSDCLVLAKSDYIRYSNKKAGWLSVILYALLNYNYAYCFLLRMSKYKGWMFPFFRWRLGKMGRKYGISFSRNVKLGYGIKIVHAIGIIINATAVIGNNCTIHQLTTIGSDFDNAAVIGDNVYIGPGVCIVENVSIGKNTIIGAGAVVVDDIPAGSLAVGVPAIVKKQY